MDKDLNQGELTDYRFNNRNFSVNVEQLPNNGMENQPRIIGISYPIRNGKRYTGEEFYPLNWFDKHHKLKPEYKELIEFHTQKHERIYKYVTNTSQKIIKTLYADKDEDLLEIICLYISDVVENPYIIKKVKRPILAIQRNDIHAKKEIKDFSVKYEIHKELYSIMNSEDRLNEYILLLGYNPALFANNEERFVFLVKKSETDTAMVYSLIKNEDGLNTQKAMINMLLQNGIIKLHAGKGYFYNEIFLGTNMHELIVYYTNPKNANIVSAMSAYVPQNKKILLREVLENKLGKETNASEEKAIV